MFKIKMIDEFYVFKLFNVLDNLERIKRYLISEKLKEYHKNIHLWSELAYYYNFYRLRYGFKKRVSTVTYSENLREIRKVLSNIIVTIDDEKIKSELIENLKELDAIRITFELAVNSD